jgi:hypothetical protein
MAIRPFRLHSIDTEAHLSYMFRLSDNMMAIPFIMSMIWFTQNASYKSLKPRSVHLLADHQ